MQIKINASSPIFTNKVEEAVKTPKFVLINKIDEEATKKFREDFNAALSTGQEVVPIVIDSYGGHCYSGLAIIDIIKSSPVPVATIVNGKAMSCGLFIATAGTEGMRFATETSTFMMHEVSGWAVGKTEELKVEAEECIRLNELMFKIMAENCGKKKNYFMDIYRKDKVRADWTFDAKEAKKHNIINEIRFPKMVVDIQVKFKFE